MIALDFGKAFDTVRHVTLLNKLLKIDVPGEIYNWMRNGFDGRTRCTNFNREISHSIEILASIVQGSAIGLAAYVVTAADLRHCTVETEY
jgi:Reverse transcriptase (RNA-dependent DNA polymerase)